MNELAILVLGMAVGALIACSFIYTQVARTIAKSMAILGIGVGVGLLTWGILGATSGEFRPLRAGPIMFVDYSQAIGWGAGALAMGVTAVVLAFVRDKPNS